jgi:hypothetical protein
MCRKFANCALALIVLVAPGLAQSQSSEEGSAQAPAAEGQARPRRRVSGRTFGTPCWTQAGITPQNVNQRWKIEDQGKVKIAGVCGDASLSPEQRRAKIDEINKETDQEVASLIPAKQLQAFKSCQAELDKKRPPAAGQKEVGPCGGVIPPSAPEASAHEH